METHKTFADLFHRATGFAPYPYQERMATADLPPARLSIPTGMGKTAAVVLDWLWRRRYAGEESRLDTPRRLIYCLPMRVLVEQTRDCIGQWLAKLDLTSDSKHSDGISLHILMGGETDHEWDRFPEQDAIIVGTQDMLLSRALNRGYSMSRFRWPMAFALLNSDCTWVMDEVQLMGSGLNTTTQLQAFRRLLGILGATRSCWMSATMRKKWLETVDFSLELDGAGCLELEPADHDCPPVKARYEAVKILEEAPYSKEGKTEAEQIAAAHLAGTLTLVVVNRVNRAAAIYKALKRAKLTADLVLIHSRFRPPDRTAALEKLLDTPKNQGTIAISTQVVEAGVDVSAQTLFTDLAPWPALVQRFGRCNRAGEYAEAKVKWFNLLVENKVDALPYEEEELRQAATKLVRLSDVGPVNLPEVSDGQTIHTVIRRKDLIDLFDTTPDLAGADLDVSPYIREADQYDLQVFWRDVDRTGPPPDAPPPARDELCSVPLAALQRFKSSRWRWDHLDRSWVRPNVLCPGMVIMLPSVDGGYNPEMGWTGKPQDRPTHVPPSVLSNEGNDDDRLAHQGYWQTLANHSSAVVDQLEQLLAKLPQLPEELMKSLRLAARWHDAGKAHPLFQEAMLGNPPLNDANLLWAKTIRQGVRYRRRGFRHELASALAMLAQGHDDLAAYLAAAHHGKVRLSIRALPHEKGDPNDLNRLFARGIWHGESLPSADLGGGVSSNRVELDLTSMELGEDASGPSWLFRMLVLKDRPDLGPFRLAWLETLLRVADWRASAQKEVQDV